MNNLILTGNFRIQDKEVNGLINEGVSYKLMQAKEDEYVLSYNFNTPALDFSRRKKSNRYEFVRIDLSATLHDFDGCVDVKEYLKSELTSTFIGFFKVWYENFTYNEIISTEEILGNLALGNREYSVSAINVKCEVKDTDIKPRITYDAYKLRKLVKTF